MKKMRRPRRYADGGPAAKTDEEKERLIQSYAKRTNMSPQEIESFRKSLGLRSQNTQATNAPTTKAPAVRSPNAQAGTGQRKKKPLVTRPKVKTQTAPAPRTRTVAPPPPPPAPVQTSPAPSQGGMLGGAMNAIEERNKMLQGLRRGGLVKKKKPVGRMPRPRRTKR